MNKEKPGACTGLNRNHELTDMTWGQYQRRFVSWVLVAIE